ncbi:ATP-binding protein [Rhizobium sp. LC145]|uniref:ATP-binding protein n=1 Tax=Rhizobium sp. LC145 TaxID=1120688 RepID=UPI00062A05B5|nr:ATP-binding protein [Rhizobium sp. LC145]KKX32019.1 histidine kinase [Rhizobium sp. LC145]TKT58932.1 PAS domain S-box protein [Rhizobiaceae bacterium LC148]
MSAVQYPFIDIAVHERVRDRFAAGEAIALFSPDMRNALWANGRGADLFGFSSVYDFLDQGPNRTDVAFRQMEAAARQLSAVGESRSFVMRVTSGFQRIAVQATCELIRIGGGTAVLFAAPAEKEKLSREALSARMLEGLDDPDTHMAVLDGDGAVIAASPDFDGLGVTEKTAKMLVTITGNDPSRLTKRPIPTSKGYLPAAIGKLSDEPALHLLFTVEALPGRTDQSIGFEPEAEGATAPSPAETADTHGYDAVIDAVAGIEETEEPEEEISLDTEEAVEAPSAKRQPDTATEWLAPTAEAPSATGSSQEPEREMAAEETSPESVPTSPAEPEETGFVFRRDARATRFVWKIDAEGRFREISGEFAETVGPHAADIKGMAFSRIAALFRIDPEGKVTELLGKRDTWSGKTIWWPVEGTDLVVPVDLAALPTYTRAREFDGFRGFGIVRVGDARKDPEALGLTLGSSPARGPEDDEEEDAAAEAAFPPEAQVSEPEASEEPPETVSIAEIGDEVLSGDERDQIEETGKADDAPLPSLLDWPDGEPPAIKIAESRSRQHTDKVIQFEERRSRKEGLTPGEQAAFQEIARQLDGFIGQAKEEPDDEGSPQVENEGVSPEEVRADVTDETPSAEPSHEAPESAALPEEFGHEDAAGAIEAEEAPGETEPAADVPQEEAVEDEFTTEEAATLTDEDADLSERELLGRIIPIRERIGLSPEIVDQMPIALLVHSGDRLIHGNPEFLRLTGYPSIEALAEVGGLDALLQRQELEDKTAEAGGMVVVRADDVVVPVTARLQSVRWEDSTELMLALMPVTAEGEAVEDGAEAVQARPMRPADQLARLQVEVEELRAILETATDGVVIIDANGDIRSMNRAASGLFNYDNEETSGKPFVMLFAHESQRAIMDYLGGLSGHGVASVLNDGREVIGREASGGFLPLFMTIGRLTSSNGFCAVIRDITQWKRTEEELRTAKRAAETANAHKSEFLAHVSHEIRTPLNAIIGFADMMAGERFGPIGHPRYVEYANDIGRSGRHVLDIVNDLLDISKIEAGEMDLDFVAVGLNETVSEAVSLVQPQANSQRVIIRTALSHSVPPVVADLRSVKQIALNILSNAIRFTPSGGQIVVSTAYEPNGSVMLRIRDTGIGMTRSELELAMKPFRQVAGGARKRGDGTGLGLPLTKAMVDANRASFAISSSPNEGTLVEITFPPQRVLAN